ncbi:SseB family protein [Jiangella asiatica]|uniref:SseB family protein n=1 Tax=Jiangella asiatica TaxID=2530372 RepID=UPI0013A5D4D0|nr:SseB family protein [Jiangella asiatica]
MTSAPRRPVPSTPFGDDDGSADPRIEAALAAYGRGEGGPADVLAALAGGRLLIPVVAVPAAEAAPDEVPTEAVAGEKLTEMATVLTTGRDGRRGLLAFTCVQALQRWDPEARPTPVPTRSAAEAALADGADALVIDLAGPVVFSVDTAELRSLAAGWRPLGTWAGLVPTEPVESEPATGAASSPGPRVRHAGARVRRTGGRMWRRVRRAMIR